MITIFFQGLLLGFAYVAPIGIQNLFVIQSAISQTRKRAYFASCSTIFFDITLALACFLGVGLLLNTFKVLTSAMLLIGGIAVVYIGANLLLRKTKTTEAAQTTTPLPRVIWTAFAATWFNPQAIIDGSLFLGGFRASLGSQGTHWFIFGFCTASIVWFLTLTTIVTHFRHAINEKVNRLINTGCGMVMIGFGLKLIYLFFQWLR